MRKRATSMLADYDPNALPRVRFSTDDRNHVTDDYFLNSADQVAFFFEEDALDEEGRLTVKKENAINKIGHALHQHDPFFREVTCSPSIQSILQTLGYQCPVLLQSMLIFKQPRIGGKVTPHQDSTFLHTQPLSAVGFWMPMEDATVENGCLWFIPGSHKTTPIQRRFKRNPAYFEDEDLKVPKAKKPEGVRALQMEYEDDVLSKMPDEMDPRFVKVEVPAGACVVLHGSVVHKSDRNQSAKSRFVYAFHAVEGEPAGVQWSKENWLQMPQGKAFEHLYDLTGKENAKDGEVEASPLPRELKKN